LRRGLLLLVAAGLTLPLAVSSAGGPARLSASGVELIVTLKEPPLARASLEQRGFQRVGRLALHASASVAYLRGLTREQDALAARIRRAIPGAKVRWHYGVVLNGLAVVAPAAAAKRIGALPGVAHVYPGVRYRRSLYRSPAVIGAPQVWGPTLATAGDGIKIGVLDDGVDQSHPFFSPTGFTMPAGYPRGNRAYTTAKVIVARSFAPPGASGRYARLPFDPNESEHGTHVAGIAAGDHDTTAPGPDGPVKVSGIAPRAYIGNYRVLTIPTGAFGLDGNSPEIVAGIERAVLDGMDVINLSLGEPEITPSRDVVVQAIDAAADAGVVPVIAAGNEFDAMGPGSIDSPGSAPKAITAAAASKSGLIADFSSGGPAPVSLRLKPDVTAPGVGILSSVPARDGSWRFFDGTSMAAPHTAGAAALLVQRHPGWTVAQVKSALVLTGNPVKGNTRLRHETPPTREGGGMIWLPRADQPLVFARPTSLSFGLLRRGGSVALRVALSDAGGGAGAWAATVLQISRSPGVALTAPAPTVPGTLTLRAAVSSRAPAGDGSGFVVLTRAGQTRRIPYWLRVTVPQLEGEPRQLLTKPGVYQGDTRRGRALVSSYRYPASVGALGVPTRLRGPEQVFRFVLQRPVANAGAVILSHARGTHISPRLVQGGNEDRLAGFSALPIRINPYQPGFYAIAPVVGVFRPNPGRYDLVFDTPSRGSAGPFSFRFWIDDTSPPSVRLPTRTVSRGERLRLLVTDRGSGVDPSSMLAQVDGRFQPIRYGPTTGLVQVGLGRLAAGRHRLVFTVADYQETKNTEDASSTLPNTRRLTTTFVMR
jgi:subtilisin family serine protease